MLLSSLLQKMLLVNLFRLSLKRCLEFGIVRVNSFLDPIGLKLNSPCLKRHILSGPFCDEQYSVPDSSSGQSFYYDSTKDKISEINETLWQAFMC